MSEQRRADRLRIDRIARLCHQVGEAIKTAAKGRATAADALAALIEAQRKSSELCEEVDKLVTTPKRTPPRARKKR